MLKKTEYDKIIGLYEAENYSECFELLHKYTTSAKLYVWFLITMSLVLSFISVYYSFSLENASFNTISAIIAGTATSATAAIIAIVVAIGASIAASTAAIAAGIIAVIAIITVVTSFSTGIAIVAGITTVAAIIVANDLFIMLGCKISIKEIKKMVII